MTPEEAVAYARAEWARLSAENEIYRYEKSEGLVLQLLCLLIGLCGTVWIWLHV